ncbi:hypothetical protein EVAR_38315_1 [Eumeta japonica]|uniref:Uncharacterized protein n=1 Tax=Eumeta variegata TaxID=151549 RepID=A0A4C1W862_EUMVA|nr:hypothetical protein EVAR_38315_1 [Eumeta japonica]
MEDRRRPIEEEEGGRRRWVVIEERRRGEGRGSLTRTALAAAVRRVDSLISGRQARSVRSTPTRVTDACRLDPVGDHRRSAACAACSAPPSRPGHYLLNPVPPPDAERMRGDARPRVVQRRHRIDTTTRAREKEEVEGHGSLTRTALAAAVRRVDSLISGRQARSVDLRQHGSPMRAALMVGVHQRPTTGRLRVQLELCLLPSSSTNTPGPRAGAWLRSAPACGSATGLRQMSINGSKDHYHFEPSGSVPDEKTPGMRQQ